MTPLGKYMRAEQMGKSVSGKTKIWDILAQDNFILGTVKWKPSWRCYVFEPAQETCFNATCLTELSMFLGAETTKVLHPTRASDVDATRIAAEVRRLGLTGEGEGLY